jgi:xanthine dehydrogenase accessory factor
MLQIIDKMGELIRRGETFAVATVLKAKGSPGRIGHKMIVRRDGTTFGTVGGGPLEKEIKADCLEALRRGEGISRSYVLSPDADGGLDSLCGGKQDMAIEIVPGRPHVLIVGGGHVGRAVGRLCHLLDYGYSVVDDREEVTRPEDWPGAESVSCSDPGGYLRETDLSCYSHVLLLNYNHQQDAVTLEAVLERFDGPIGMIGSARKRDIIYENLPEHLKEKTGAVRCPVGIPIPARSPAEIAVSILGEIMTDRYGGEEARRKEAARREERSRKEKS